MRSRDTLERIASSSEELLEGRSFGQVSVSEIIERAGTSTGAFYNRFSDKRSLLLYLDDRFIERTVALWSAELDPERWDGVPLAEVVGSLVGLLVAKYRAHRGVLRAIVSYGRCRDDPEFVERAARVSRRVLGLVRELLAAHGDEIAHPDPGRAGVFGFVLVVSAIRELVLFEDLGLLLEEEAPDLAGAGLATELSRAYLTYLTTPTEAP